MEVAVPEEPQKKIFRARKTMKLSDRQQLEVLHNSLATVASNSSSSGSSSRPQTPLLNGTHSEKDSSRKDSGSKSPASPASGSSPLPSISLALSRSPSPSAARSENPSPAPPVKKASEKGKGDETKGEREKKVEKKTEEAKADKTETLKSVRAGSPSSSDKKSNQRKPAVDQALNGEMSTMDIDSASLDNVLAEESCKGSSTSSPSGSPSAGLECDPEVKEGFLCLSEEEEGQGERDEVKEGSEEKMDMDTDKEEKKEADRGCKVADSADNSTPAGKKRALSPVDDKDGESKGAGDGKRAKVDGVELEAQLELKITAKAGSRLKLEKVVQQLVEERIRMLQQTVFDRSLQELKDRVEKIDVTIKEQKALQHITMLNAKVARLSKKFGNANQASENSKKETAAYPAKATATASTTSITPCTTRNTVDPKQPIPPPGSTSSSASPAQPKPLSTPTTPTSSALASTAPILQIISTTTSSTPVSSTTSLSGQSQQGTLVLQTRASSGVMSTSTASSGGQPMSIQPLLIQLPLPAGGVGLIPVSSLATASNVNKAKTTTATTTFILQKASAGNVVPSSVPLSSSTTPQMSLSRPAHQGGTGTVSSPSAAVSVTTARAPTQCAAVVGVATASSSPAATGPAATGSSAASTAPPSASAMTSKTDNQASNSAQTKSPAQPARPKGSVIDLTEDDDDVQVTGVQKAPATPTTSSQRTLGPPPPLVSSSSGGRTAPQQRPSVDSPSKSRPSSSSAAPLPPLPLAPTPPARLPPEAALTTPPQQPQLKLARVQSQNGIVLSWCVAETDRNCAQVDSYHLYAYHQDHQGAVAGGGASTPSLWKKIGEVKALPLPMACTLTQFVSGSTYYFAVRAKDVYGRFGPFCEPQCTDVINSTTSGTS